MGYSSRLAWVNLSSYIDGWLQQANPKPDWDYEALYERFVGVSVALDILATDAPGDEALQVLATLAPRLTPFFNGLDLWLQRRALHACVAHSGVRFIDEHWVELRVEAILSGGDLGQPELLQAIQSRLERTTLVA